MNAAKLLLVLGGVFVLCPSLVAQVLPGESKPSKTPVVLAKDPPKFFLKSIVHPDEFMKIALRYQESLIKEGRFEDLLFTRFILFNTAPGELLNDFVKAYNVTHNTVNTANTLYLPVPVSGSEGRLFAIDLRRTRWTVEAFTAAVRFDLTFREPHCDGILAEQLRKNAGVQQEITLEGVAKGTAHIDIIAPGLWWMREILEPGGRTNTYYFLTYSEPTFGKSAFTYTKQTLDGALAPATLLKKEWKQVDAFYDPKDGKPWEGDGKFYAEKFTYKKWVEVEVPQPAAVLNTKALTLYAQQRVNTKVIKNFPENLEQFQEFHGITDAQKALDKLRQFGTKGEVVEGSKNTKVNGSEVSFHDRIVETLVVQGNRTYMRTRDFKKTSGKGNPANNPRGVVNGDIEEDAGEHLFQLGNGLQTALLTGGAKDGRKRVEAGDAEVVRSSRDTTEVVVKTQVHCFFCHAPSYGVVPLSNRKVTGAVKRDIRLLEADLNEKDKMDFFFEQFDEEMEAWRIPYKRAVRKCTEELDAKGQVIKEGWTGQRLADVLREFRDWYDAPVSLDQAAAELGVSKLPLLFLLLQDGSIDSQNLLLERAIPRAQWDDELYVKLALIFAANRVAEKPNPLIQKYHPELLQKKGLN